MLNQNFPTALLRLAQNRAAPNHGMGLARYSAPVHARLVGMIDQNGAVQALAAHPKQAALVEAQEAVGEAQIQGVKRKTHGFFHESGRQKQYTRGHFQKPAPTLEASVVINRDRKPQKYDGTFRRRAVALVEGGESTWAQAAEQCGCDYRSVKAWCEQAFEARARNPNANPTDFTGNPRQHLGLVNNRRSFLHGRTPEYKASIIDTIIVTKLMDPSTTYAGLIQVLQLCVQGIGPISMNSFSSFMRDDLGWRRKQFEKQWVKSNVPQIIGQRRNWAYRMLDSNARTVDGFEVDGNVLDWLAAGDGEVVSVDEMSINTAEMTGKGTGRGSSPRGITLIELQHPKEQQLMVVAAVGRSDIHHAVALAGNMCKEEYVVFLQDLFHRLDARGLHQKRWLIIQDNAKPHDAQYVSNAIRELQQACQHRIVVYRNTPYLNG
jgi:transposase-like protein